MKLDLFEEIKEILVTLLDIEAGDIGRNSYLVRDLGVESIDFLELAVALNERFQISVDDDTVFMRNLRLHLAQAQEQGWVPLAYLQEQYGFLPLTRLEEMMADLEKGPVIQVQDVMGYVQWQMTASKAA